MKKKLRTFVVHRTFKFRMKLDSILYNLMKKYNHWELLDELKGKDVLVVGNGPSLKKTELNKINMVSIGMNKINLLFDKTDWRPTIITCVNGLVICQNREFFNKTNIILILPVRAWYLGIKKRKNVIFVRSFVDKHFKSNLEQGIDFCGSTVTYTALQIAAHLSPRSVNIVGVDHNFTKNVEGRGQIEKFAGDDDNHFDPNYFKGQLWGLPNLEGSEVAYYRAKEYFDISAIPITDYTINGKCHVFNKGDIKELYN